MQATIKGSTMPVLEMLLDPGEAVISTHGDLSWMTANMQLSQTASTGSGGGIMAGLKRMAGGGGLFLTRYEPVGGQGMVTFAAKLPGRIFPVDVAPGAGYVVHRHGWLCGTTGITPSVALQQSFRGGLWGGEGFVLQKLEGQGQAWIELSGEIAQYDLAAGQSLLVHPGHVGLFSDSVTFSVMRLPGIANRFMGQDGHHVVSLTGPGSIWLQSMPIPVLAQAVSEYLPHDDAGRDAAAGGVMGGVLGGVLGRQV
ncbi:MAG TPA: AIM24 family protein [Acidimicrobiales bacterium]|nr:AIM24 family protein [Acidimicrobiales bacterium]